MANKNLGIGIGIGLAGVIGYFAARALIGNKKKGGEAVVDKKKAPAAPDTRPKDIICPACGEPVREYEYFCPACKHPMEQKTTGADTGTDAGAAKSSRDKRQ